MDEYYSLHPDGGELAEALKRIKFLEEQCEKFKTDALIECEAKQFVLSEFDAIHLEMDKIVLNKDKEILSLKNRINILEQQRDKLIQNLTNERNKSW